MEMEYCAHQIGVTDIKWIFDSLCSPHHAFHTQCLTSIDPHVCMLLIWSVEFELRISK